LDARGEKRVKMREEKSRGKEREKKEGCGALFPILGKKGGERKTRRGYYSLCAAEHREKGKKRLNS